MNSLQITIGWEEKPAARFEPRCFTGNRRVNVSSLIEESESWKYVAVAGSSPTVKEGSSRFVLQEN